jgi:hypothetical protein
VSVFKRMLTRARLDSTKGKNPTIAGVKKGSWQREFDHLAERAGIVNFEVGRARRCYTPHSTRVGGTCMLIRAGLDMKIISALADWSSDMVEHYGKKVMLNPECIEPIAFYSPKALARSYGGVGQGAGSASPSRK